MSFLVVFQFRDRYPVTSAAFFINSIVPHCLCQTHMNAHDGPVWVGSSTINNNAHPDK